MAHVGSNSKDSLEIRRFPLERCWASPHGLIRSTYSLLESLMILLWRNGKFGPRKDTYAMLRLREYWSYVEMGKPHPNISNICVSVTLHRYFVEAKTFYYVTIQSLSFPTSCKFTWLDHMGWLSNSLTKIVKGSLFGLNQRVIEHR